MQSIKDLKAYLEYLSHLGLFEVPLDDCLKRFLSDKEPLGEDLDSIRRRLEDCKKCSLHRVRKHPVWGDGEFKKGLMLITEYPDREEDFYSRPFVGEVGRLLERMLLAIGLKREDFFITHAVKCKTPGGRPPDQEEISSCSYYLFKQIKLLKPKLVLAMGFTPPKVLLNEIRSFSNLRGKVFELRGGVKVLFTYHPAYVLKNPGIKRLVWEDLQKFRKLYEEVVTAN